MFSYLIFDILLSVIVIVVVLYFCVIVCVGGCESVPVIVLYCIYLASKLILLASKTIHNDNYQIIAYKFYVMLNGEADRRESFSLLELSLPNKQ